MFEQALEEMTALIYVDDKAAEACSQNGISLHRGGQQLSYSDAVHLLERMEHLYPSVPKYQQKRFRAMANGIRNAFGPDFWERHPDSMDCGQSQH